MDGWLDGTAVESRQLLARVRVSRFFLQCLTRMAIAATKAGKDQHGTSKSTTKKGSTSKSPASPGGKKKGGFGETAGDEFSDDGRGEEEAWRDQGVTVMSVFR